MTKNDKLDLILENQRTIIKNQGTIIRNQARFAEADVAHGQRQREILNKVIGITYIGRFDK